jgi:hypothetical protein
MSLKIPPPPKKDVLVGYLPNQHPRILSSRSCKCSYKKVSDACKTVFQQESTENYADANSATQPFNTKSTDKPTFDNNLGLEMKYYKDIVLAGLQHNESSSQRDVERFTTMT